MPEDDKPYSVYERYVDGFFNGIKWFFVIAFGAALAITLSICLIVWVFFGMGD